MLGVAAGAALTVVALLLLLGLKVRRSRNASPASPAQQPPEKPRAPDSVAGVAVPRGQGKTPPRVHAELPLLEEKDPDLIPAQYGEYQYAHNTNYVYYI